MVKHLFIRILFVSIVAVIFWIIVWHLLSGPDESLAENSTGIEVIAHRGGRGIAPENTLFAFDKSDRLGADVFEMDIHLTKDHQLVVIHDATINRTTNGKGKVEDFSLQELRNFDAAYFYSPNPDYNSKRDLSIYEGLEETNQLFPLRGKGITIPSLFEVFKRFPDKRMILEIKPTSTAIIEPLCRMIKDFHKEDQVIVGSYHVNVVDHFRKVCPGVVTSASPSECRRFVLFDKVHLAGMIAPDYVALQVPPELKKTFCGFQMTFTVASHSMVRAAHKKGLIVQVWTINDPGEMKKIMDLGVDGITTDYPDKLIQIRNR
jgi:glycerophosphoryl diester phosphodiesterase